MDPKIFSKVKEHLRNIFTTEDYEGYYIDTSGAISQTEVKNPSRYDLLWSNYTWFDFFEQHVASAIPSNQLVLNCPVERIRYRKQQGDVVVSCGRQEFVADHIVLTSSLGVLQDELIQFQPQLPSWILEGRERMWRGFKFFIEFKTKFYPDYFVFEHAKGEEDWWDYSKYQDVRPKENILSGYYMGTPNRKFEGMSDSEIIHEILKDIDKFPGMHGSAHASYKRHKIIHYSKDFPWIRGTYSQDCPYYAEDGPQEVYEGRRLLLAGEAFPIPKCQIGWVDGAALSGLHAAELILNHIDASIDWFSIPDNLKQEEASS
ncbi:MAG: hypothetical protein SGILL_000896 [Bacillariaceae sp.]